MENKTNVKEHFKIRFSELRAKSGLSQSKLGKLLGLSAATIGYYENGDRIPDIATASRIAEYFDVSVDYLLGLSDVKSTEQNKYTTLEKCWYQYYTGKQGQRKHRELKLVCTECHYVWDTQAYAFKYCPNCGREVVED